MDCKVDRRQDTIQCRKPLGCLNMKYNFWFHKFLIKKKHNSKNKMAWIDYFSERVLTHKRWKVFEIK